MPPPTSPTNNSRPTTPALAINNDNRDDGVFTPPVSPTSSRAASPAPHNFDAFESSDDENSRPGSPTPSVTARNTRWADDFFALAGRNNNSGAMQWLNHLPLEEPEGLNGAAYAA